MFYYIITNACMLICFTCFDLYYSLGLCLMLSYWLGRIRWSSGLLFFISLFPFLLTPLNSNTKIYLGHAWFCRHGNVRNVQNIYLRIFRRGLNKVAITFTVMCIIFFKISSTAVVRTLCAWPGCNMKNSVDCKPSTPVVHFQQRFTWHIHQTVNYKYFNSFHIQEKLSLSRCRHFCCSCFTLTVACHSLINSYQLPDQSDKFLEFITNRLWRIFNHEGYP